MDLAAGAAEGLTQPGSLQDRAEEETVAGGTHRIATSLPQMQPQTLVAEVEEADQAQPVRPLAQAVPATLW